MLALTVLTPPFLVGPPRAAQPVTRLRRARGARSWWWAWRRRVGGRLDGRPGLDAAPVSGDGRLTATVPAPAAAPVAAVSAAGRRGASRRVGGPAPRARPASPARRCAPTRDATLRSRRRSPRLPTSAGRRWPASGGWSRSTARSAVVGCGRTARPEPGDLRPAPRRRARRGGPARRRGRLGPRRWSRCSSSRRRGGSGAPTATATAYATARTSTTRRSPRPATSAPPAADLSTGPAWVAAVRSYNHSDDYVRAVYAAAETYAARSG